MKNEPLRFDSSRLYLDAIAKGDEVFVEETENQHLGNCEVRIIVAICFAR
jgi:hypothetical protein